MTIHTKGKSPPSAGMQRHSLHLSLPADLVAALKTRAAALGIPLSHLVSELCQQGLALPPPEPTNKPAPSVNGDKLDAGAYERRLQALEAQVQQIWQQLTKPASPADEPTPSQEPPPSLAWDPVTHDFDSWLLTVWSHHATDKVTGEIRWGSPVSADQIHATGFQILRKQAFLDRLASSEAPGLTTTSWDPEQPDMAWISCRIQTVIFANPAAVPDEMPSHLRNYGKE